MKISMEQKEAYSSDRLWISKGDRILKACRPKFDEITSFDEFKNIIGIVMNFHKYSKSLGLEYRGTKQELNYIIEQYFKGDLIKNFNKKIEERKWKLLL